MYRLGPAELRTLNPALVRAPAQRKCCRCLSSSINLVKSVLKRIFFCFFPQPQRQVQEPSGIHPIEALRRPRRIEENPREVEPLLSPVLTPSRISVQLPERSSAQLPVNSLPLPAPRELRIEIEESSSASVISIRLPENPIVPTIPLRASPQVLISQNNIDPLLDLPDPYTKDKEELAIAEAKKKGGTDLQLKEISDEFARGRAAHCFVIGLHKCFQNFHKNPQAYLNKAGPQADVFNQIKDNFKLANSRVIPLIYEELMQNRLLAEVVLFHKDDEGTTILHWAAAYGYDELVQKLISRGANPASITTKPVIFEITTRSTGGYHPFKFEIGAGKNYDAFTQSFREKYLQNVFQLYCCGRDFFNMEIMQQPRKCPLVDRKMIGAISNVNEPLPYGNTYLHLAVNHHFSVVVFLALLEKGADPLVLNEWGKSALDIAISQLKEKKEQVVVGEPETKNWNTRVKSLEMIVALFLDAAEAKYPENFKHYDRLRDELLHGNTFFHLAVLYGNFETSLDFELRIGLDSRDGYNPLASAFDRMDNPWKRNKGNRTVFDYAQVLVEPADKMLWYGFILPLYKKKEEVVARRTSSIQEAMPFPRGVIDIVASFMYDNPCEASRRDVREAASRGFERLLSTATVDKRLIPEKYDRIEEISENKEN